MTFGFFTLANYYNIVKAQSFPKISMVALEHNPFVVGEKNSLYLISGNYDGDVQYQIFYNCKASMGDKWQLITNDKMPGGWTFAEEANKYTVVDISSLDLKKGTYKFSIRVKGFNTTGAFKDEYGDYDDVYIFNAEVLQIADMFLNGKLLIDKNEYKLGDNIKIDGVKDAPSNIKYKLNLYNLKTGEWSKDLTDYGSSINYNIKDIPAGVYLADIYCKKDNSDNAFDGEKLQTIIVNEKEYKYGINICDNKLYKCYEDGSSMESVVNERVNEAQISGDWIYYVNSNKPSSNEIWKIKKDGTNKTFLTGEGYIKKITIEGNWIYFINNYKKGNKLYRIKNDGTELTLITEDTVDDYKIYKDCIYDSEPNSTSTNRKINKMNLDGKNKSLLADGNTILENYMLGDWIYYEKNSLTYAKGEIYKVKYDGSETINLVSYNSGDTANLTIDCILGDWIYYDTNTGDGIGRYKVKIDGYDRGILDKDAFISNSTVKAGDWYYYIDPSDYGHLYRVKIDGTQKTKLTDESVSWFKIYNEKIYYNDKQEMSGQVYSVNLDGSDKSRQVFDYIIEYIEE